MNIKYFNYAVVLAGGLVLGTSCIDDKYDLSDIDTTTAIKLDGLVVPVRLNEITLDQVLKVEDNDPDDPLQIVDGQYVIQKFGSFMADPVMVDLLEATDHTTVDPLKLFSNGTSIIPGTVDFSYLVHDVDEALKELSYLKLINKGMEVTLSMTPSNINYSDLIVSIPEDYVATYKGVTYSKGEVPVTVINGNIDQPFYITEMTFIDPLTPEIDQDGVNTLDITGPIGIAGGNLSQPYTGVIEAQFTMNPFTANVASGKILKEVDSPDIEPVSLTDLPDFLTDGETTLILSNPQIYFNFPAMYGASYTSGISIDPQGMGTQMIDFNLKPFETQLVVAPNINDLGLLNKYPNAEKQPNEDLQNIIKGKGIPERIYFSVYNTMLSGYVNYFELGQELTIEGDYTFFAPLSFEAGSEIIYNKTETDFFGDDMEDVEVSELQISANVTSKVPVALSMTVYPLDKDGNKIPSVKGGYIMAESGISPNATNEFLDLHFTEPFKGLDGVEFTVKAYDMNGVTLTPEQTLNLTNIKAKVTGEYVTKL